MSVVDLRPTTGIDNADQVKLNHIDVTADVNLDPMQYISIEAPSGNANSAIMIIGPSSGNVITDTINDSNICISATDSLSPNRILGEQDLRGIWGGYDNTIDAVIASNCFGTHHSVIEANENGHNSIYGGGSHRTLGGVTQFSVISGGQQCTTAGSSAVCVAAEFSNAIGSRTIILGSTDCMIGMKLGTGVATTTTNATPDKGDVITLADTSSFGSVDPDVDVLVAMDSITTIGRVYKVPFTVRVTSDTELTIQSNGPVLSYFNMPNIVSGALVYPLTPLATNGANSAIIASDTCQIKSDTNSNGNLILCGASSTIQNHTTNPDNTLYPSYTMVVGSGNTANAPLQRVEGVGAVGHNAGQWVRSYGNFSTAGDCQSSSFITRLTTTNASATVTTIPYGTTGALGQHFNLKPSRVYGVVAHVTAVQSGGSTGAAGDYYARYRIDGIIKVSSAGAVTVSGATTTAIYESNAAWDCSLTGFSASFLGGAWVTNNNGELHFSCTGEANRTIRWTIRCDLDEIAYA